jgi:hypothetical protein
MKTCGGLARQVAAKDIMVLKEHDGKGGNEMTSPQRCNS